MATFVNTGVANMDSFVGKTGGDTYTNNGGTITIDGHTRYDLNGGTSATIGTFTNSATSGGTTKIRADETRLLAYNTGSGNVPAIGTTISQGSASGKLLAVYSALNVAPTAAGAAVPSSGYILVKQWNSVAYSTGALTGIGANVIADPVFGGTGRDGWIEVVFDEAKNMTVNRLNNPNDDIAIGADFYIGITDGTRATQYQIPSNGSSQWIAGVEVETAPGSNVYEWWACTSSTAILYNIRGTGAASKHVFLDPATATFRFGHDGTNSTGGACPVSGCKVRMPNIILTNAPVATRTVNSFPASSSRYYIYPLGAGRFRLNNVSSTLRVNVLSTAYEIMLKDSTFCGPMNITSPATPIEIDNCCIGTPIDDTAGANHPLTLTSFAVGGDVTDSVISVGNHAASARTVMNFSAVTGVNFENVQFTGTGMSAAGIVLGTNLTNDITMTDCSFTSGYLNFSQTAGITITDTTEASMTPGDPYEASANVNYINLSNKCSDFFFDDWAFPHDECLGKGSFIAYTGSCTGLKFRNMGDYNNMVNAQGPIRTATYSRSGTVATWTLASHGYRVGDYLFIYDSATSNVTGFRQVATVPTSNTFTTTATNSGGTTGSAEIYRTTCSTVISSGANTDGAEHNNIFVEGAYNNSVTTTSTASRLEYYNVGTNTPVPASFTASDIIARGVSTYVNSPSASSAQYGHSFHDGSSLPLNANVGGGYSWTRSGTTMTIALPDHKFDGTSAVVRLMNCSDTSTESDQWEALTSIDKDTVTAVVSSAGATLGTIDVRMSTDILTLYMNEQSDTVSRYTILSGNPAFTGSGTISMPTVGDKIVWEQSTPLINYTAFNELPIRTNLQDTMAQLGCFLYTYDIAVDDGAFGGTEKVLMHMLSGGTAASGQPIITGISDTSLLVPGMHIWATGIPYGTKILSVDSSTQITLDTNLTATLAGVLMFSELPGETFTDNFKLKIYIETLATNALACSYVNIHLDSDATSRANLYPVTVETVDITVTGIAAGYRIQVYNVTQAVEIDNDVTTGSTYSYVVTTEADDSDIIRIRLAKADKIELQQSGVFSSASGVTILAEPEDDDVWTAYGVDGSALTAYAWDSANEEIEINETGTTWSQKDLYAWYKYFITTATGIDEVFGLIEAKDAGNIELGDVKLDNLDSNSLAPEDEIRVYRSDDTWIVINPTTGGGDLGVYSTGTIYVKNINTATNVITGDIADVPTVSEIVDGVLDEAVSGHQTSGSVGRVLKDSGDNAENAFVTN